MKVQRYYRSGIEGLQFPGFPPPRAADLLAVLAQLDESQWWPAEHMLSMQRVQLTALLKHAMQTVPFYQRYLPAAGFHVAQNGELLWDQSLWSALPLINRQQVQNLREQLHSQNLPKAHGETFLVQSSGSTGRPVQALGSGITSFYWNISTLRDNLWHRHDFMKKFAAIRPDRGAKDNEKVLCESWGAPVDWIYKSVPTLLINSRVDVRQQLLWLQEYQPVYLLSLPSNLRELLRVSELEGITFSALQQVRTYGETVTAELREQVRNIWNVGLTDIYSSQEVGYMALQCPDFEHYHVQSETMFVEVLDDNNQPCAVGEIGRVIVTSLHNFAMPLIRYEVGDYAEVGGPCPCGRGLPVLKRIVGRTRNMVRTPDGKCYWPSFPTSDWLSVADIKQFQLRQVSLERINVIMVMQGQLTEQQKQQLEQKLHHSLGYPFSFSFEYVDEITRLKNGKFEDFISEL